jgi:hypothetical protein
MGIDSRQANVSGGRAVCVHVGNRSTAPRLALCLARLMREDWGARRLKAGNEFTLDA